MKAIWNGVTIAQSDHARRRGQPLLPARERGSERPAHERDEVTVPVEGLASYYHVEVGKDRNPSAAWTYRHPYPWIRKIKNRVAFWSGVEIVPE